MDQERCPVVEALQAYIGEGALPFHMPGHKGGRGAPAPAQALLGRRLWAADVTEIPGLDDLQEPAGCLWDGQQLLASLYGAGSSFFLVNGSSCGIAALLLTALRPGDEVLVPRNAHRSVLSGLVLSGARPVFVPLRLDEATGIPLGLVLEDLDRVLAAHPAAKAAVFVHPTYHGAAGDLASLAAACRRRGLLVLVDEAHGVHLPWAPGQLPPSALACGADACVQSAHKLAASLTQSAWLHVRRGSALDAGRLKTALQWLQTSSPSYLLLASLDAARWQLAREGKPRLQQVLAGAAQLRALLGRLPQLALLGGPEARLAAPFSLDATKVTVSVRGWTGEAAMAWLRHRAGVVAEWADGEHVLLLLTMGDEADAWRRLAAALEALAAAAPPGRAEGPRLTLPPLPPGRLTPREAAMAPWRSLPWEQAAGQIAAEAVTPYPPGIPAVLPGEELTPDIIAWGLACRRTGVHVSGLADGSLKTIRVVDA